MADAVKHFKYLDSFQTELYFPAQPIILDEMEANGVQLKHFGFNIDDDDLDDDLIEEGVFTDFQTSQPISTISSLAVNWTTGVDFSLISRHLSSFCLNLNYLTRLYIGGGYHDGSSIALVEILQDLKTLKSLEFEDLMINDKTGDTLFSNKIVSIYRGPLKSICFVNFKLRNGVSIEKFNRLLSFALLSCADLKSVKLIASGIKGVRGAIDLDFRGNQRLRNIELDIPDCR